MPHDRQVTPLEAVAALYGLGNWSEAEYRAARAQAEMQETAQQFAASWCQRQRNRRAGDTVGRLDEFAAAQRDGRIVSERDKAAWAEWAILGGKAERETRGQPVHASLTAAEGSPADDEEWSSLWPPVTRAEADRRERQHRLRIAASKAQDEDDDYRAVYGEDPPS